MHLRPPSRPVGDVCWQCQCRLFLQHPQLASSSRARRRNAAVSALPPSTRSFHATRARLSPQAATAVKSSSQPSSKPAIPPKKISIRKRLKLWQEEHGGVDEEVRRAFADHPLYGSEVVSNRLSAVSKSVKSDQLDANEQYNEDDEDDLDGMPTMALFLKPGDVVEIAKPDREPVIAVFVRQADRFSQFYSANGRITAAPLSTISFVIPGCIDPALVTPLVPYFPTNVDDPSVKSFVDVPHELSSPVQELLLKLTREAEATYRQNAAVLDDAYSTLADRSRLRLMPLDKIARTLLGGDDESWQPSHSALLAVRKALFHNPYRFRPDIRNSRLTNIFGIRSKGDVNATEIVLHWVREYAEAKASAAESGPSPSSQVEETIIGRFAAKARRLVAISRKYRDASHGYLGPNKSRQLGLRIEFVEDEKFSGSDKQIIAFLKYWALSQQFGGMSSLNAASSTIIHAVGLYNESPTEQGAPPRADADRGLLFLQEIGVAAPYENRALYDEHLMLPTVHASRDMDLLREKVALNRKDPGFGDSMEELRHDLGTMNVYCIDDPDAKEIDDGISISRVPGKDSEFWIHVHVANPTAFFERSHVVTQLAAHMTQTVYMPERAFPMLPDWVTQKYFSLAPDRPALTISSRVNRSGLVLESKIRSSIVRRVTAISPAEVDEVLAVPRPRVSRLVVGGSVDATSSKRAGPPLTPDQIQDLRDLQTVAASLIAARLNQGALRSFVGRGQAKVYENPEQSSGLTFLPPSDDQPRLILNDPIIEVSGPPIYDDDARNTVFASNIVEESMILACSTAGAWCAERNIPMMYRGSIETPMASMAAETFREKVVKPYLEKHGKLSRKVTENYIASHGKAIIHTSPLEHKFLGLPCYTKVTSPLRRFSDMVGHWQIESALRYEASSGRQFNFNTAPPGSLPFRHDQMQKAILTFSVRETIIKQCQNAAGLHWACLAFLRAHFYGEARLPETVRVYVRRVKEKSALGAMTEFGFPVHLREGGRGELREGDEWDARVEDVSVYSREIWARAERLVHREEEVE